MTVFYGLRSRKYRIVFSQWEARDGVEFWKRGLTPSIFSLSVLVRLLQIMGAHCHEAQDLGNYKNGELKGLSVTSVSLSEADIPSNLPMTFRPFHVLLFLLLLVYHLCV